MDKVISQYTTALDELNVLTTTSFETASDAGDLTRVEQIADDVFSLLIRAYTLGMEHASLMLVYDLSVDIHSMNDAIFLVIDGKTFEDRVADHVITDDLPGLKTLVESEFHRVYNTAVMDGGKMFTANGDFGVSKNWITVKDDKVRETHSYLEGQSVALEDFFYTFDGDYAAYPGGFNKAENNVNCRCIIRISVDE